MALVKRVGAMEQFTVRCVQSKTGTLLGTGLGFRQRFGPFIQRRLLRTTTVTLLPASKSTAATTAVELPYGLKLINYASLPPLTYSSTPLYTLPPPPPHLYNPKNSIFTSTIQPMLAPILAAVFFGSAIYLYLYPEKDVYEYWKQVEQGNVPVDGDDDDDEDDDEDDASDEWDDE
jgi:hypothetical protein